MTDVVYPIYKILEGKNIREIFGKGESFMNLFAHLHDIGDDKISDLPENEKLILWNESLKYVKDPSKERRLTWCKAVYYFEKIV